MRDDSGQRPSQVPPSGVQDVRAFALEFVEGVRRGWTATDLAGWCWRALVTTGFLKLPADTTVLRVYEPSTGTLELALGPDRPVPSPMDHVEADRITVAARDHVIGLLRGLLATPEDDRFLQAAIHAGHVVRKRPPGSRSSVWMPELGESIPLGTIVAALFAADALARRDEYEQALRVCRECGGVGFDASSFGRSACPAHARRSSDRTPVARRVSQTELRAAGDADATEHDERAEPDERAQADGRDDEAPETKRSDSAPPTSGRRFSARADTLPTISLPVGNGKGRWGAR